VRKERRIAMSADQEALFGIEKLNVPRSDVPAITHVDYSARVQTVSRDRSPDYFDLIARFEEYTGCPLVVNTSFNVRGEPIVCTPRDAYVCFMRTDLDHLVLGPFLLHKTEQPEFHEEGDWRDEFELD
jgi:carbamoyltransferase